MTYGVEYLAQFLVKLPLEDLLGVTILRQLLVFLNLLQTAVFNILMQLLQSVLLFQFVGGGALEYVETMRITYMFLEGMAVKRCLVE